MSQSKNRILNALPQNIFDAVEPHLNRIDLPFGMVVAETNRPVEHVYFPETGVISLVVEMTVGDMIETAMVGRDGVVNGTSARRTRPILRSAAIPAQIPSRWLPT